MNNNKFEVYDDGKYIFTGTATEIKNRLNIKMMTSINNYAEKKIKMKKRYTFKKIGGNNPIKKK